MHNLQKNIDGQSEIEALSKTGGNPLAIKSYIQKSRMETSGTAPLNLAQSSANQPQNSSFAAAGLDNNFNAKVEDGVLWVFATAIQSDGKYLIGGTFQTVNDLPKRFLARLNADGNLDGSFNAGNSGPNGYLEDIELLPDGKILISGGFTSYNGISRINIARLNSDGSLDETFNPFGGTNGLVDDVLPLADGKILIAGVFSAYNGVTANSVARLNSNGTLDTSFSAPTINSSVQYLGLQSTGKIIISGGFTQVGGVAKNGRARLNADGSLDDSFTAAQFINFYRDAVAIQPDDKILIDGGNIGKYIVRLNPDGTVDSTFNSPNQTGINSVHSIIVLPNGQILAGGYFDNGSGLGFGVFRFNSNGSIDTSFTRLLSDQFFLEVFSMTLAPNGKIFVGGDFVRLGTSQSEHVALLNNDGTLDNSLTTKVKTTGGVYAIARQPDGKVIIGGDFARVNGVAQSDIARLNPDGSLDTGFKPNFFETGGTVLSLTLQTDGKILVGGQSLFGNGISRQGLIRLNPDGSVDNTFSLPADATFFSVYKTIIQPDGKILVSGQISSTRLSNSFLISVYRLNSNGSADLGFSLTQTNSFVFDMALSPTGSIYIGGGFTVPSGRIARLNPNGTVDTGFNVGGGTNFGVRAVDLLPDGKLLVGGNFTAVNGVYANRIARLNQNGSVDSSFETGLGFNGTVLEIQQQPDNKILVGGSFNSYNGIAGRAGITRLNSNGSLDSSFTDSAGTVYSIVQLGGGNLLIGGFFTGVNGTPRLGIARLSENNTATPPNDDFANAAVLQSTNGTIDDRNVNASAEPGEPAHAQQPATRSIWYRWNAPFDGVFSFTTAGSSFDTVLAAYTGADVSNLTLVTANDDVTRFDKTSRVVVRATTGVTYFFAVDGKNGESGSVRLSYKQSARSYRFYAQTGNGNVSPRIPVITATREDDGAQFVAEQVTTGVYELDLPVDTASYIVRVTGTDTWSPSVYRINNQTFAEESETQNLTEDEIPTGPPFVTRATTVAGTVSGILEGVSSPQGVNVSLGSEGGPNPISPRPCGVTTVNSGGATRVRYDCQFLVDTKHQIKPTLAEIIFSPKDRQYPILSSNIPVSEGTRFNTSQGSTYRIAGIITEDGTKPLGDAVVTLSGRKNSLFITGADGRFNFTDLPANGDYTVSVSHLNFDYEPRNIRDLNSNQDLAFTPKSSCIFSLSGEGAVVSPGGGTNKFTVATASNCQWRITNNADWITLNANSGYGTGDVIFTVRPNNGASRSTNLTIGNYTFTIKQNSGCTYVLTSNSRQYSHLGGAGSVNVAASNPNCTWTAEINDCCMLRLTSASGTGNGVINFVVERNRGIPRGNYVKIDSQYFYLLQDGAAGQYRPLIDFDGDNKADIAVFRPSNSTWYNQTNSGNSLSALQFGATNDRIAAADYNGDNRTDIAVFRDTVPGAGNRGYFYIQESSTNIFRAEQFGATGDKPISADFDGDRRADLAVYRDGSLNGGSSLFIYRPSSQPDENFRIIPWGIAGDRPVPADYDGDGRQDAAVFRPSSGDWFILRSSDGQMVARRFGSATDVLAPADYDGDRRADIAVFRNGVWYVLSSETNQISGYNWGIPGDVPVADDYNGDGMADLAVFRPSDGVWYIWSCRGGAPFTMVHFGTRGDVPALLSNAP